MTGSPPTFRPFLLQLVEWTGAVIMARIICGSVVRHFQLTRAVGTVFLDVALQLK